jgi:hypothetical protein
MNATTTPLWAATAILVATLACIPANASSDEPSALADLTLRSCFPVTVEEGGQPTINWDCVPIAVGLAPSDPDAPDPDTTLAGP